MVILTKSDPCGNGDSRPPEPPGDDNDLEIPPVTPRTPPTSRTEDNRQPEPDEDRTEDSRPLTPLSDHESDEDRTDSRAPLPDLDHNEDQISVIRPVPKKRHGKQKDNGIGDQNEDQESGDATQSRATKRRKTTTPAKPQAKPKPRPKVRRYCLSDTDLQPIVTASLTPPNT